jgi:hypothetical protein
MTNEPAFEIRMPDWMHETSLGELASGPGECYQEAALPDVHGARNGSKRENVFEEVDPDRQGRIDSSKRVAAFDRQAQ